MTPDELRAARIRLGMTPAQLGKALRLKSKDPARTVRTWEAGTRPITGPVEVAIELMLSNLEERK